MSGIHDEVVEEGKGGEDLASVKLMKNLNHQKRGLSAVKITGCPERSPVLRIEVVFLYLMFFEPGVSPADSPNGMMGLPSEGG